MSFFHDKQSRRFFISMLMFCILMLIAGAIFCMKQTELTQKAMLQHDEAIASSLIEQRVDTKTIAAALSNAEGNEQGRDLLSKIGFTERTAARFFPELNALETSGRKTWILGTLILAAVLIGICLFFLRKRERIYQQGADVMEQFLAGDFSSHLPREGEGTLFRLFGSIEKLALALQSKSETERQVKEFLKSTISDISHQLKTPLAALSMYNEIIAGEPEHPDTVLEFSEKAQSALQRMEQLIQSLLKLTRLDAGSILFAKTPCLVSDLIKRSIAELTTRAAREQKTIELHGRPEETVRCDPEWTAEAIGNLVKNALDHTDQNGTIRIAWERSPAMLRILISDNGSGIAEEDLHHIFKRFYRSKASLDRQGVGLGLPLAKTIVEGQGGLLAVQSTQGEGTTFTLSFLTEL